MNPKVARLLNKTITDMSEKDRTKVNELLDKYYVFGLNRMAFEDGVISLGDAIGFHNFYCDMFKKALKRYSETLKERS